MSVTPITYCTLGLAIVLEVIGTSLLQRSEQFTRLWPSIGVGIAYLSAFYFLSLTLKTMPVGIAYAIWSGAGIILISAIGVVAFKQTLDTAALIGLGFIIIGAVIVNVFSKSVSH